MTRRHTFTTVAIAALALGGRALGAQQITEVSRTQPGAQAQLTFGYLCDDRFVVRNDGTQPVQLEYGLHGGAEHTKLSLNPRESVELASKSRDAVELWMDGKRIASAEKENRSCRDVQGTSSVAVQPPAVVTTNAGPTYVYGPVYPYYDPYWSPWYVGFGFGYYTPIVRPIGGRPIIWGRIGGHRR